jgi:diguanylate cyclase (GGDEF)-like protein
VIRGVIRGIGGALLAGALLWGGLDPRWGEWAMRLPLFLLYPLYRLHPAMGLAFAGVFVAGSLIGRYATGLYASHEVWSQAVVMSVLAGIPWFFERLARRRQSLFDEVHGMKKGEHENLMRVSESILRENGKIETQLRDIGHLYDVMRDAGSALNVQEMLSLVSEHTERMFNLPHFVMAMLSEDGRQYEIKISSGCDEDQFRGVAFSLDPTRLAARMAKERRTLWVEDVLERPEFAHLADLSILSFVFIPFIVQNQVIGFFCSFSSGGEFINPEKFTNLQIFYNQISIGLQKALLYEKVQRLSITDGLTRLFSHRYFRMKLDEELALMKRYASNLVLMILDIDHFKRYNDSYGHVAGDQVLMETAKILKETCDVTQTVARYGGEEMVILAPETTKEQGAELAEKIRARMEEHSFKVGKESTQVMVSIGVAAYPQDAVAAVELIANADKALYTAKEGGRNRVVLFDPELKSAEKKIDTPKDGG